MFRLACFALLLSIHCTTSAAGEPWPRHTIDDSSRGADGVRLADVNSDGLADIATGWEEGGLVRAYVNPGPKEASRPWPAVTVGSVKSPEDAVFADLDGDGATDVVSSTEDIDLVFSCENATGDKSGVRWLAYDKSPREAAWQQREISGPEGIKFDRLELLDLDRDGDLDVLCCEERAGLGVVWYENPR